MRDDLSDDLAGRRYASFKELRAAGVAPSRPTMRGWIRDGLFPAPIRLGPRKSVWDLLEVKRLLEDRKERPAPIVGTDSAGQKADVVTKPSDGGLGVKLLYSSRQHK